MKTYDRRQFLKGVTGATFSLALFNPFKYLFGATNLYDVPKWRDLVEVARWCPTVHNLQAHKLQVVSDTVANLYYDPSKLLPVGDPKSIFSTIALGIFIEHLSIVAAENNYRVIVDTVYDDLDYTNTEPTVFAKLKLVENNQQEELTSKLIKKRRTSRLDYEEGQLDKTVLEKLKMECEKFDNEFFYTNDKEFIDYLVNINQETLFKDLSNQKMREELDWLFRYNKDEAEEHKDGLWAKCMGFKGSLLKSVFRHHKRWIKGFRKRILRKTYLSSFDNTQTVAWIGGAMSTKYDLLNNGRMLARNWLLITKHNAYIQPFGSLITNELANKKINEKFTQPSNGKEIWLIYRVGYSKEPARSYRLSTDEILIN